MKIDMMDYIKVHSSTPYQFALAEFGDFSMKLHALKLTKGFEQWLVHLPSSCLVNQGTSLIQHLTKQGIDT